MQRAWRAGGVSERFLRALVLPDAPRDGRSLNSRTRLEHHSMNSDHCSSYRGCAITTRCIEARPPTDWASLEALPSAWTTRFTASFSVRLNDARDQAWQEFPKARFDSCQRATNNALFAARCAIDLRLAMA